MTDAAAVPLSITFCFTRSDDRIVVDVRAKKERLQREHGVVADTSWMSPAGASLSDVLATLPGLAERLLKLEN